MTASTGSATNNRHSRAGGNPGVLTIPGTDFPFPAIERKGPPQLLSNAESRQRRGLLAKIHVAKKQMRLSTDEYGMILRSLGVSTAADLPIGGLEKMVKLMKHYGWKPMSNPLARRTGTNPDQLAALRIRCVEAANSLENGEKRLAGLALKICGTSQLVWCHDARKLERLLAVLGKISTQGVATPYSQKEDDNGI
ncbi:MAG: phage protein GemA/Gp16 family protein [Candidatus Babeliales bacterium]